MLFKNYSLDLVSQLGSPFTNTDAKDRQNQILKVLVSPQHCLANLMVSSIQLFLQNLPKGLVLVILFEIEIIHNLLALLLYFLPLLFISAGVSYISPSQFDSSTYQRPKLLFEFLVIVVHDFYFRKHLTSTELVYLVSEQVGCCVSLQSQLQLSHYSLLQGYFKSDVWNRDGVGESALHFSQPVAIFIISNVILNFMHSFDNVHDRTESALTSHHITDFKLNFLLLL